MIHYNHIPARFIEGAQKFLEEKRKRIKEKTAQLWEIAPNDAQQIIDMIISEFKPKATYQWGSLLEPKNFLRNILISILPLMEFLQYKDSIAIEKKRVP